jgi:hypothetical protein
MDKLDPSVRVRLRSLFDSGLVRAVPPISWHTPTALRRMRSSRLPYTDSTLPLCRVCVRPFESVQQLQLSAPSLSSSGMHHPLLLEAFYATLPASAAAQDQAVPSAASLPASDCCSEHHPLRHQAYCPSAEAAAIRC